MSGRRKERSWKRLFSAGRAAGHRRRRARVRAERLEPRQVLAVVVSEFMAANQRTLADDFGEYSDWIELHNNGASAVNLQGWSLTDDADDLRKWRFPAVSIGPGEYLIVYASDRDRTNVGAPLHTNFRLSAEGEFLALVRPNESIEWAYAPQYPAQVDDVSYGLSVDGQQQGYFPAATPGGPPTAPPLVDVANVVVINEVMYSLPRASILDAEAAGLEFIELHNRGPTAVNVTGWRFTRGIDFTFPAASIPAGGFLVVAADTQAFRNAYPSVTSVVGGWTGTLSNRGETIELVNAAGVPVDQVTYADQGDWAVRAEGPVDRGATGWIWTADHDAGGKSLELINAAMPNDAGHNWGASIPDGGTPGRANSRASTNIAPLILDVIHNPPLPRSTENVHVTARLSDELGSGITARVYWRDTDEGGFQAVAMTDDGAHGDGQAGDGIYGATLPARPNLTVVEYYVEARDATGLTRTWPAPTADGRQETNALYQVLDAFDATAPWTPGSPPIYHVIMTPADRDAFNRIDRFSNAQFHATFIAVTGTGIEVRYNAGVRYRGSGSRTDPIPNNRINLPSDRPWQGIDAINVNQRNPVNQIAGSALYRLAGIPAADVHAIRLFSNGIDLKNGGYYVHSEVLDSEYAENHFPIDSEGNLYRGRRDDESPPGGQGAGLLYRGEDPLPYVSYEKETNAAEADWSDVIELTYRLNVTPDDEYVAAIQEVVDVSQWFRTIAIDSLMDNGEFGLLTGDPEGDDYAMYRGINDPRFRMIPYDWDTLFGNPREGLFPASRVAPLTKLIMHSEFLPEYYAQYLSVIDNVLENPETGAILDNALRNVATTAQIDNIKQFLAARAEYVRGQIQQQLTVTSELASIGGVHRSTDGTYQLSGLSPEAGVRAVRVGDDLAELSSQRNDAVWNYSSANPVSESLVDLGNQWRYLADGSDAGTAWRAPDFNDSAWPRGPAQLGYGDGDEATTFGFGGNPNDRYVTTYFRTEFHVDDPDQFDFLSLRLIYDDGAAVFLNGTEVLRVNLPESAGYNTLATELRGRDVENAVQTFPLPASARQLLIPGRNVLAVEVHQGSVDSPDLSFDLALDARRVGADEPGLRPGMNRIPVRAYDNRDGVGTPLAETTIDLWYDNGRETLVTGTIAANTRWTAADGPYRVRGNVVIAPSAVLTIEPGTTVWFENNARLTVGGGLVAVGSPEAPIWFTRLPGQSSWGGIQFEASSHDNRIEHAILQYGVTDDGMLGVVNSRLTVDHALFDHTDRRRIRSIDSSLIVRNSTFTDIFPPGEAPTTDNLSEHIWGSGIPDGGEWLVQGNSFGHITGHNDSIDFDAPQTPGVYARVIDNQFHGGGDDALDLTGHFWIEGNLFQNFGKDVFNTDPGQSNTISSSGGEFWVVRNVFDNVHHAALIKEGAFMHFLNNTVVGSEFAPLYFDLPGQTSGPGRGARVEGSIFAQVPTAFDQVGPATELQVNFSFLPAADEGRFGGLLNQFGDPHVGGREQPYALRPGSKARAMGPGGVDMGAAIPAGAQIVGGPGSVTGQTSATLFVAGPGVVEFRYQIDNQPVSAPQGVQQPIRLSNLAPGNHQLRVWGRDASGTWQTEPTLSDVWRVDTALARSVRINEVLADNRSTMPIAGDYPDLVELYNEGGTAVDLSGYSISDRADQPRRFVFPPGTLIQPNDFLLLHSGVVAAPRTLPLGFGLNRQGDGLYLFDPAGTLVDAVQFGPQLADLSLGRWGPEGSWTLNEPTLGQPNRPTPLGDPARVRINEWYANGEIRLPQDMIELFNPEPYPVALGGYSLTDEPFDIPDRSVLPAFTFIAAEGYLPLIADGDPEDGPDHLDFSLSAVHEHLALLAPDGTLVDQVFYYGQTSDVSQGRVPDGATRYEFRRVPTFGDDNGSVTTDRITVLELPWDATWRYEASGSDLGTDWRQPAYNDAGWQSGPGLLGNENEPLPVPMRTQFPIGALTYYFRQTIDLETNVPDLRVELSTIIDDGVIVYVNGQEVLRNGMPASAVDYQARANRSVNEGELEGPFVIPNHVFVPGQNVIAVEVHQVEPNSSDLVFGLHLLATAAQPNAPADQAELLTDQLRITEVMYHPAGGGSPEYIELQNVGDRPLELGGVRLGGGIDFEFPAGTQLGPRQYIVVTDNVGAFRQRYGQAVNVAGQYAGRLSDDGEELVLLLPEPLETAILRFTYSPEWHASTDGRGAALTIVEPQLSYRAWASASSWQAAAPSPGRDSASGPPGDVTGDGLVDVQDVDRLCLGLRGGENELDLTGDGRLDVADLEHLILDLIGTTFGDANLDGVFNSSDFVHIFAAGKYENLLAAGASWSEGDWDCSGRFDSHDLVVAFQYGGYSAAARPEGGPHADGVASLLRDGAPRPRIVPLKEALNDAIEGPSAPSSAAQRPGTLVPARRPLDGRFSSSPPAGLWVEDFWRSGAADADRDELEATLDALAEEFLSKGI